MECFENPKLNSSDQIKSFLSDNLKIKNKVIRKDELFKLNYEIKVDDEKLVIWKVLHYLKPRSFRVLRFSLTWPNTNEAEKAVKPILKNIPNIIEKVQFSLSRTVYDDLASIEYKLNSARCESKNFWEVFKLIIPTKWLIEYSVDGSFAKVYMNSKKVYTS